MDLPDPDSPTKPEHFPLLDGEDLDRGPPDLIAKGDGEMIDFQAVGPKLCT